MSKKILYLFGIILTIGVGTVLYCCLTDICECFFDNKSEVVDANDNSSSDEDMSKKDETPVFVAGTQHPFEISDPESDFNAKADDNFKFSTSTFKLSDSIPQSLKGELLKLKDYLVSKPSKHVTISGLYNSTETNTSAFTSIGEARANTIKNYLVSLGIPVKQLNIKGQQDDAFKASSDGDLFGPFAFSMTTVSKDDTNSEMEALKVLCNGVKANPMYLYFNYGEAAIELTEAQRKTFSDITKCVDKMGLSIVIEGHTDSESSKTFNQKLGQKRADFAKNYFIQNGGVLETNIKAVSYGETKPMVSNATEEGRTKNRRTVITIN